VEVLWYLTAPDGRYPWAPEGARVIDHAYLTQIARAVDHLGYTGALLATGPHDTWVLASSLLAYTERMRFLVAVHPGLVSPTLLAKMSATFDQFSGGRLILNIVNGESRQLAGYGLHLGHDERYAHSDEYLTVWKRLMAGETVDFAGEHVRIDGGSIALPPVQRPHPPLWFGGSSPAALDVAAKHIDTYLSWGETPPQAAEKIAALRGLAAGYGRADGLRFGIRLYVIVRDTEEEAWAQADWLLRRMDPEVVARAQERFAASDSVGQRRMWSLHRGAIPDEVRDLEIYPNLWAGMGLIRQGPGTAIVGNPEQVVDRINEYRAAGIETFIVSGVPLLEEAYRVAELVLPHLPVDGRTEPAAPSFTWESRAEPAPQGAAG
jgi:alkanesulfonate monooxygenase